MSWKSRFQATREEMQKDGLDLLEQVIVLVMGGVLGGQAYTIAQRGFVVWVEILLYLLLLTVGVFALGSVHFVVSYNRVLNKNEKT